MCRAPWVRCSTTKSNGHLRPTMVCGDSCVCHFYQNSAPFCFSLQWLPAGSALTEAMSSILLCFPVASADALNLVLLWDAAPHPTLGLEKAAACWVWGGQSYTFSKHFSFPSSIPTPGATCRASTVKTRGNPGGATGEQNKSFISIARLGPKPMT